MMHLLRPNRCLGTAVLVTLTLILPAAARSQTSRITQILEEPGHLLHSNAPGYLGVLVGDIDSEAATRLRLKDSRGAVVTLIDHDAPAAQAGIHVNDVLLELNGKAVQNAEQFGSILHGIPAGHNATILLSRDGNTQTLVVQLVDRKKMEHDVWNKLDSDSPDATPTPAMGILASGSGAAADAPSSGGFHMPFFGSSLNVGAIVEPLTAQMADYLGVESGLMIKQVAHKSAADAAGLHAFDVILKVGSDPVHTVSDWERALRSNQGKPVQLTILRDKKQQTLTLQVDSRRHHA
ncbi:MAG: PDZ domain-containing protein [Acidobacteriota bacterium]|nr:PDZ domain-containing protein [Acidobacteriota bacterium]